MERPPPGALLAQALHVAREVHAPDWLLGAGAIRDAVWDASHHRPPAPPREIDLGFFDGADVTPERDREVEAALRERAPGLQWEAKNQAAVHFWYPARFGMAVEPFGSSANAIETFPETASCVGAAGLRSAAGESPVGRACGRTGTGSAPLSAG